ncbi:MAG: DNA gyrase inhibitor YacG [Azoarcus sp.]|jgi:endogenous inhibitor of DNA gyrase (YacG/DUF329 family)|nr:DNA gyrase inhibitor YacG [Azoarcus sp.]
MSTPSAPRARTVCCPQCGKESVWSAANPDRPFCSARCKQIDLGAWASGQYRIPAAPPDSDPEASGNTNPLA